MDNRNQELQTILHHIGRIETELRLLRQAVQVVLSHHEGEDQDLILVDAELVNPDEVVDQPQDTVQEPRTVAPRGPRTHTRRQLLQDGRWRAQNWAIREQESRAERDELERLGRAARQNRN
jgi:nitrogen fixation protein FixH